MMKAIADFVVACIHFVEAALNLGLALVLLAAVLTVGGCMVRVATGF